MKTDSKNIKRIKHLVILPLYRYLFARKWLFALNRAVFTLSLRGIGILNNEDDAISGEKWFLEQISGLLKNSTVIDVGANVGDYSNKIKSYAPTASLYSFEPHPKTFECLIVQSEIHSYEAINAGCGSENKEAIIYDYEDAKDIGTVHASLYEDVISEIHSGDSRSWIVKIVNLDDFAKERNIDRVRLVKIDVEGAELEVLNGMKGLITSNKIDIVQFEFNEMNVCSRVFLRDIKNLLSEYRFYRLLPDGIVALGEYSALYWEIFAYQNVVAINENFYPEIESRKIKL